MRPSPSSGPIMPATLHRIGSAQAHHGEQRKKARPIKREGAIGSLAILASDRRPLATPQHPHGSRMPAMSGWGAASRSLHGSGPHQKEKPRRRQRGAQVVEI